MNAEELVNGLRTAFVMLDIYWRDNALRVTEKSGRWIVTIHQTLTGWGRWDLSRNNYQHPEHKEGHDNAVHTDIPDLTAAIAIVEAERLKLIAALLGPTERIETDAAARFSGAILLNYTQQSAYDGQAVAGDDLEKAAIDAGLMHAVSVTEACQPFCNCACNDNIFPRDCVRLTEAGQELVDAADVAND